MGRRSSSSWTYASDTASVGVARGDVHEELLGAGIVDGLAHDVLLAVSELVANAVQASSDPCTLTLVVGDPRRRGAITVEVVNTAPAGSVPPRAEWGPDHPMAVRGRGLMIVAALADEVRVQEESGRVSVRARFVPGDGDVSADVLAGRRLV